MRQRSLIWQWIQVNAVIFLPLGDSCFFSYPNPIQVKGKPFLMVLSQCIFYLDGEKKELDWAVIDTTAAFEKAQTAIDEADGPFKRRWLYWIHKRTWQLCRIDAAALILPLLRLAALWVSARLRRGALSLGLLGQRWRAAALCQEVLQRSDGDVTVPGTRPVLEGEAAFRYIWTKSWNFKCDYFWTVYKFFQTRCLVPVARVAHGMSYLNKPSRFSHIAIDLFALWLNVSFVTGFNFFFFLILIGY